MVGCNPNRGAPRAICRGVLPWRVGAHMNQSAKNQTVKVQTAITPTREQNYSEWYQQVVKAADLAENSAVRGCMVIKPWGYAIWENIQRALDKMFKDTGHKNAYFPLFLSLIHI